VKWLRRAAEQRHAGAQFVFGVLYREGEGVAKDDNEALKWFRKAAEQGEAEAQYELGVKHDNGQGVVQDHKEAIRWYRKAAEQCVANAQYNLGVRYMTGVGVSKDYERRICRVLGQHRSTQRRRPRGREDEDRLVADMIELVRQYGRYGYRRITALLRDAGWQVNDKRIERLWRREGLKVPMKQPKKGRLWLNDGSCIRLRPEYRDHVWSYDFVHHRTDDGKVFGALNILDEHSRECLAIRVNRRLNSTDVIDVLTDLFILRGVPAFIRSDNGPEFVAESVRNWIKAVGAKTAYIKPGSPWENGYCESFNARFRDELLNGEIFYTLKEAQIIIEQW
jgi:transposase InsO family protein